MVATSRIARFFSKRISEVTDYTDKEKEIVIFHTTVNVLHLALI